VYFEYKKYRKNEENKGIYDEEKKYGDLVKLLYWSRIIFLFLILDHSNAHSSGAKVDRKG
jgi:hypothetical protein